MRTLAFSETERFAISREELWPLVADTARLNRAIGLRAVSFRHLPRDDGGSAAIGEYHWFGLTLARWTEHAFAFVRPQRYSVLREYSKGPLVRLNGGVELTPDGAGTVVRVFADITARNFFGQLLAQYLVGPISTSRVLAQCRFFEAYLVGLRGDPFPQLAPRGGVDGRRLDDLLGRLVAQGADQTIAEHLREHLRHGSNELVVAMRAFQLADTWGTDRRITLETFLRATTVGLLDLRWDVLCPNCRIPKAELRSLSDLRPQVHCDTCNIGFDSNFDRLVEVRFGVSRSIREAGESGAFCIGGPQVRPHLLAQAELDAGGHALWELSLPPGLYRLRSPQVGQPSLIEVDGVDRLGDGEASHTGPGSPTAGLDFALTGEQVQPPFARVPSGLTVFNIDNRIDASALVDLEETHWLDTSASAALVTTFQEFRDLFSSEVLAPGVQIGIEKLALLFTDLAGSTALYEHAGQARAFRLVQDQFQLVGEAVRSKRGAVVKTIGDAVMAVFPTALDALNAAVAMQRGMIMLEAPVDLDPTRLLKVGIHTGPCVAVTMNDRLDYFGTAVNVAARVEHEARGGETMLTETAFADPGVAELVESLGLPVETAHTALRGVRDRINLVRIPYPATISGPDIRAGSSA